MADTKYNDILIFIQKNKNCSSAEIHKGFSDAISYATVKRILSQLLTDSLIVSEGKGKSTRYAISPRYELIYPVDLESYYQKEIDERQIKKDFNWSIFELLENNEILSETEILKLAELQQQFTDNISYLSDNEYKKELERLAIDLSWKSS